MRSGKPIPGLPHIATGRRRTVVAGGTDRLRTAVGRRGLGHGPWQRAGHSSRARRRRHRCGPDSACGDRRRP
ncbi:hypothetical protein SGPA1_10514 [Streptomyces misionensis JCM 4497]